MNCNQAKQIKIESFLSQRGINPVKIAHNNESLFYKSPFRDEKTPSFKVNTVDNVWYDHGAGEGGKILDLVMIMENCDLKQALEYLAAQNFTPFLFSQAKEPTEKEQPKNLKILSVTPVRAKVLLEYLEKRKISRKTAHLYLHQVTYTFGKYEYKSLGFKNDRDGYELRNSFFKNCTSKYFTTINGTHNDQLNIFEGFMDFLSAIELGGTETPKFDCLILNSVSMKEKTFDLIGKYDKINLFLDNDKAGEQAAKYFRSIHDNVVDYSKEYYPNQKDLNDYLIMVKNK
jgi:DNA primase